jgi:Protein of unknown function (DUF1670)
MNTPTTPQQQARRLSQKGLRQQLCERFEHDYGFDKGRRVIPTIVDDILALVAQYFGPDRGQQPNQIIYTTAHANAKLTRGLTMAATRQQAIRLTMVADEDCAAYVQGAPALRIQRMVRWLCEAQLQGGLLTTADLTLLSGVSRATVERQICAYEQHTGKLLPLRGTVHDATSKVTHKAQIVQRHLDGQLATEIARATDHSLEAVEHYLRDFELVRELAPKYDVHAISRLIGRGTSVVRQYLRILQDLGRDDDGTPLPPEATPSPPAHPPNSNHTPITH